MLTILLSVAAGSDPAGKKVSRRRHDLPKPTQAATMRDEPLNLDANLNKTMVVGNTTGRGPGQPGFYVRRRCPCFWRSASSSRIR